jgi:histone acetyltransferase (RNA polymerase elongator complex component)
MREIDIEELNNKFNKIIKKQLPVPSQDDIITFKPLIELILQSEEKIIEKDFLLLKKKYKFYNKKTFLFHIYLELKKQKLISEELIQNEDILRQTTQTKPCKSWSGVVSITIFTSPYPEFMNEEGVIIKQKFSCNWNCHFCPSEPNMPKSYLKGEPAVLRAEKNNFDCVLQIWDRMHSLYMTGHGFSEKIELIISGGTWTSYPIQYRREFCRDVYYAANTYWDANRRERLSLEEEKKINQTAFSRIVVMTVETRPDTINNEEIILLRDFGITRIQLGIQHIDDEVLNKLNRKCSMDKTIKAIELLKRSCFKIDSHWMPNLPFSTPEKDENMFLNVLFGLKTPVIKTIKYKYKSWWSWTLSPSWYWSQSSEIEDIEEIHETYDLVSPELVTDQYKIYPTAITPWTKIEEWYKDGTYKPYEEKYLFDILIKTLTVIFPFVRANRIIRDFPNDYIYNEKTGADNTNMRQQLLDHMKNNNINSMEIRNREVKNTIWNGDYIIVVRNYKASNGIEYFISAESKDCKIIYGYTRLRLDDAKNKPIEELNDCALLREVRVYGMVTQVNKDPKHIQHKGIGKKLINYAENVAKQNKYNKMAVIAAEGNKKYYEKINYIEYKYYMIKEL